jgi:hypothetical protein
VRVETRGDDIANLPSQLDMATHTATVHVDQIDDVYGIAELLVVFLTVSQH